jgi:hypothetical protein
MGEHVDLMLHVIQHVQQHGQVIWTSGLAAALSAPFAAATSVSCRCCHTAAATPLGLPIPGSAEPVPGSAAAVILLLPALH